MKAQKQYQFIINADISPFSPNKRSHWRKKAAQVAAARDLATLAWYGADRPHIRQPVAVELFVERPRLLDHDNAVASCKPFIDGCLSGALLPDDSPEWVWMLTIRQAKRKYHRLTITATVMEEGDNG